MRGKEVARCTRIGATAPAQLKISMTIEDAQTPAWRIGRGGGCSRPHSGAKAELGHVNVLKTVNEYLTWAGHICPFTQVFSPGCEQLNSAVLPVSDVYRAPSVHRNPVRDVKLARFGTRFSPGKEQASVG